MPIHRLVMTIYFKNRWRVTIKDKEFPEQTQQFFKTSKKGVLIFATHAYKNNCRKLIKKCLPVHSKTALEKNEK